MNPRAEIASILCNALDEACLPWSLTHGAEGFPERVGRDFDILLPVRFHAKAVALVEEDAGRHGWTSCLVPLRWAGAPVLLWKIDEDTLHSFEMHFIDRVDWSGCILADGKEPGSTPIRIDGLSIAIWPAFAKRVLTQILAGCWDRIGERPGDFVIEPHEVPHLEKPMAQLFGRRIGSQLLELIRRSDLEEIKHLAPSCRSRVILRAFLPGTNVRLSGPWLSGKFARIFGIAPWRPPFLVLAYPAGFDGPALLSNVISNLGFAKGWILSPKRPTSFFGRLRERWNIHVHRSLFRLGALAYPQDPGTRPVGKPPRVQWFSDRDLFITSVQPAPNGTFRISYADTPAIELPRSKESHLPIATQIANRYLLNLNQRRLIRNATIQNTP